MRTKDPDNPETTELEARRAFLKSCAKYAVAAPPAIALLLAADEGAGQPNPPPCSPVICLNPGPPPACECPDGGVEALQLEQGMAIDPELTDNQ